MSDVSSSLSSTVSYTWTAKGMKIEGADGPWPTSIPDGLLLTRAVQTKAGWVGQTIIDKQIIWESDVFSDPDEALACVNGRIVERLREMFG